MAKEEMPDELIIYILNRDKKEAIVWLQKEGVAITEENNRDPKNFSCKIHGSQRIISGLINRGYIDRNTHNFILNPEKERNKPLITLCWP